ncbi:MAG: nuclear transport factor 2 family protein [Pseudomonadota bacterium]
MNYRLMALVLALLTVGCSAESASNKDVETTIDDSTMAVAKAFLEAAGSGDGATLATLMRNDFVWHNEGDPSIPWIGNWEGKDTVLETFMPAFAAGLAVTQWSTDYEFVSGDQAVFMGTMTATAQNSGESTGVMSWAVRVHVVEGKVEGWNWFEDSYAVSRAYRGGDVAATEQTED